MKNNTQFKKGQTPWNKGLKHSKKTRKKIGDGNRGKKLSEETKRKIGLNGFHYGMLGKKMSVETRKKMSLSHKGEKAYQWQGGITSVNAKIRNSLEYRLWREAVFKRDDWTCIWCGKIGGKLHADHIKSFSQYPELRFAIDNGRTLCIKCHETTDNYKGKNKILNLC